MDDAERGGRSLDEQRLKERIHSILEEITTQADTALLNRCRAVFRREVSFFHRSYVAAWLLLHDETADGAGKRAVGGRVRTGTNGKRERPREEPRERRNSLSRREDILQSLPENEAARLFVNIGRGRRVFSRDMAALLHAHGAAREDIGAIRIFDNYSFVQVKRSAADAVITALTGIRYRGKTLAAEYARDKPGADADGANPYTSDAVISALTGIQYREDGRGPENGAGNGGQGKGATETNPENGGADGTEDRGDG